MASDGAGIDASESGATLRAEVGALPDIGRREAGGWLVPTVAALAIAALPLVLSPYGQDVVVRIAIYAIFALSLELLVGATGLVSLGHAAFLGIGAYVTVLASGDSGASLALLVPLAMGAAAPRSRARRRRERASRRPRDGRCRAARRPRHARRRRLRREARCRRLQKPRFISPSGRQTRTIAIST